jgi:hypothetical protein
VCADKTRQSHAPFTGYKCRCLQDRNKRHTFRLMSKQTSIRARLLGSGCETWEVLPQLSAGGHLWLDSM